MMNMESGMGVQPSGITAPAVRGSFRDYVAIARIDHSTKHVFIIPGIVIAYVLRHPASGGVAISILVGFCSAIAIASANYVVNEWLDRKFDVHHPRKSGRTAVHRALSPYIVYLEYIVLTLAGLLLAAYVNTTFLGVSLLFILSGLTYNVRPVRTKDKPYVDVLCESINNPIRLTLGWTMVDPTTLPPSSLLLAYWMTGAFLMGTKRLSEHNEISAAGGLDAIKRYRPSLAWYTRESLIVSIFLYAMFSAFFIGVFLIKYRIEYILAFPFISAMFAVYLWLAFRTGSIVQRPERLFRSRRVTLSVALTVAVLAFTTFIDMPSLKYFSTPSFLSRSASE